MSRKPFPIPGAGGGAINSTCVFHLHTRPAFRAKHKLQTMQLQRINAVNKA